MSHYFETDIIEKDNTLIDFVTNLTGTLFNTYLKSVSVHGRNEFWTVTCHDIYISKLKNTQFS